MADRAEFTEASTRATLESAAATVGIDANGAELLRLGSHAVYRLRDAIVARVARTAADVASYRREIGVADWLESVSYPAARAVHVDQPVVVDNRVVVFWQSISDRQDYGTPADVAHLVKQLHALDAPASLDLPQLEPFTRVMPRLDAAIGLDEADRAYLVERLPELQKAYAGLDFVLPAGVIHGDASVGNVILDQSRQPILLDLDGFAIGPREWDLVVTAMYYDSFGWHTKAEYDEFTKIYGFDIMAWPGYETLRSIREYLMVSWLSQKAGESEKFANEVRMRISSLRNGESRKGWNPY
ncbi:aminoglycoside phosphotransferase family protein [Fodinicola feengrottensis]|uniref:Aminoglycoside phosphotransferase family protein n=1 Tax=Fodinicola feengrottensis TaxID=435914 RepID=A0ABN2JAV4_9ACTN